MTFRLSSRLEPLRYAIRDLVPIAREVEREKGKVIYLNIGDPLKFDFDTPKHIKDALYRAVEEKWNFITLHLRELRS